MKHTRQKSNGMKRHMLLLPVFLVAVVALILCAAAPVSWAFGGHGHGKVELDEAEVFIEYNSTDGDFGIHFFWDGEPWKWMTVWNEHLWPVLNVSIRENVRAQGLTEAFFESAEPTLDELSFQEFLERFPEDEYRFRGRTLDWKRLVGEADFTHGIACPPDATVELDLEACSLSVEWEPVETVVDPEEDIPDPEVGPPICIEPLEDEDSEFEIVSYEAVFELVIVLGEGEDAEEKVFKETAILPATATMFTASPEFTELAIRAVRAGVVDELKGEVIAKEASGNQTITEVEVVLD